MKSYALITLILATKFLAAQTDATTSKSLEEKVKESKIIIEGRVVAQRSFWNLDSSFILTSNLIVPLKWFKGIYQDTIELLTLGGRVAGRYVGVEHSFQLKNNSDYFLFLNEEDPTFFSAGRSTYFPISVNYGVVIIDAKGGNDEQHDRKQRYNDITNELYKPVAAIVGSEYKIFAKNHHEESIERDKRKKQVRDSVVYQRTVIEAVHVLSYHFSQPHYTRVSTSKSEAKNGCKFDIQMQSMRQDKTTGEKLVSAEAYLNYDTSIIGSNLVQRGFFMAKPGSKLGGLGYKILVTDTTAGMIKIGIYAASNDSANLFAFNESFTDLAECEITSNYYTNENLSKLDLTFNIMCMSNQSKFLDSLTNSVIPFQTVDTLTGFEKVSVIGVGR